MYGINSYSGEGVNIGVMDCGIPNTSELNYTCNIGATHGSYNGTHPAFVANILLSIAPEAT